MTDDLVPDVPWSLRRMAASMAERFGVPEHVAVAFAAAALSYYDDEVVVRYVLSRQEWRCTGGAVAHVRQRLRHRLAEDVADRGYVPIELPRAQRTYFTDAPPPFGTEVPAAVAEAQPGSWQCVELSLSVRVRTPGIDRERAVEAGLLGTREG
jgi:hypothetical protein